MGQMTAHIGIEPGSGLIGRFGDTVVVVPREEPGSAGGIRELLGLVASVAADEALSAGMVAARLAAWVLGHMPGDAISFGMVAVRGSDVVVFLRGPVSCTVTEDGATRELSGERALTWVDEAIPATFELLTIGAGGAGAAVTPDPLSDLREGVVPGDGIALTWLGPAAPVSEAAPASGAAEAGGAVASGGAVAAEDLAQPPAEPTALAAEAAGPLAEDEAGAAAEAAAGAPVADWAAEPAGPSPAEDLAQPPLAGLAEPPLDFAAPAADGELGAAPDSGAPAGGPAEQVSLGHQETIAVASMPLPQQQPGQAQPTMVVTPIGELRSDDGTVIYLDRAYVLGRGPHQDPSVVSGHASPLPLRDPDNLISRIHAYVWVDQGLVLIRDPGSTHGTYISAPGAAEWTRIGGDPAQLPPGWSMRIGQQVFTYVASGPFSGQ